MAYAKNNQHNNYDIFPCVLTAGKETVIHIRPLGGRREFVPGVSYEMQICALDQGNPDHFPLTADYRTEWIVCNDEGGFDVKHTFDSEQEYYVRFFETNENGSKRKIQQFCVYCVNEDLSGRYPFMGDLHMHTNKSDGRELPEVVAANYRKYGYDFTVISDHRRYYPSLRAINCYKDLPIEMNIVPGEEVHLPSVNGKTNDVHIVNFGGEYSVNALIDNCVALEEVGTGKEFRALNGECPDIMTYDEYQAKMQKFADDLEVPENIERVPWAVCNWIFDEIRKANGLGIFAHPNWRADVYHVPEVFTDYMMAKHPFDAYEVLGGERYFEHNGFQTVRYYEEKAKGNIFPIVGSTDSHSSYEDNAGAFICETIIFSPENERTQLIDSVKKFYSVAVDTISKEFRLVGDARFVRYGCFLLRHYFPLHDEMCYEEGRLMKQYATGTAEEKAEAAATINAISGRMKRLREKYFDF